MLSGPEAVCDTAGMTPAPDEVRRQLERLLASRVFRSSNRLSRFLQFIVEQSLAGEQARLKEYVIGIEVFDRDHEYDPRIDSIVRVEAGRLRAKIEEYYRSEGVEDDVVISVAKGKYAPLFELNSRSGKMRAALAGPFDSPTAASLENAPRVHLRKWAAGSAAALAVLLAIVFAAWLIGPGSLPGEPGVTVAVLPFTPYSADPAGRILATRLTEGVTAELVREGSLGVVSSTSSLRFAGTRGSLREVAHALEADVLLEARLLDDGGRLRVEARLVDGGLDRKFWVDSFVGDGEDLDELERRIAAAARAAVASR